jgi:hypothetical protein
MLSNIQGTPHAQKLGFCFEGEYNKKMGPSLKSTNDIGGLRTCKATVERSESLDFYKFAYLTFIYT